MHNGQIVDGETLYRHLYIGLFVGKIDPEVVENARYVLVPTRKLR